MSKSHWINIIVMLLGMGVMVSESHWVNIVVVWLFMYSGVNCNQSYYYRS